MAMSSDMIGFPKVSFLEASQPAQLFVMFRAFFGVLDWITDYSLIGKKAEDCSALRILSKKKLM